jgi:hypothetical protein
MLVLGKRIYKKNVIHNYFDIRYYENIDIVKQILIIYITFSPKVQDDKMTISISNTDMIC